MEYFCCRVRHLFFQYSSDRLFRAFNSFESGKIPMNFRKSQIRLSNFRTLAALFVLAASFSIVGCGESGKVANSKKKFRKTVAAEKGKGQSKSTSSPNHVKASPTRTSSRGNSSGSYGSNDSFSEDWRSAASLSKQMEADLKRCKIDFSKLKENQLELDWTPSKISFANQ